ncbi:uncharacterized protein EV420DRAFT_43639 [Desarmillaria tabescens]|uniref:THUMP domain-containing protein n=1 Tax=Armillaria tabescens TaxID=1929756 RepID=A0AA39NQ09_ARMTA|nr:uncharacterized protein EV420DRAFT_43639 [Desarmillaria tabescens]KAK0469580.1 hypothetical protein EV420DRAFT_43639 [Desarmillaria tabescens]
MADQSSKRKSQGPDKRKKKYRSDGTPIWSKRHIDGPGVWVSCVKGKEKQTVGELYDLFDSLASDLWPLEGEKKDDDSDDDDDIGDASLSLEAQISNEISAMKRPRHEQRFANCQTNTPCGSAFRSVPIFPNTKLILVVFISCKPPVDPVRLVETHIRNVQKTGFMRTRYCHRFVPVSGSCVTNIPEIQALCRSTFEPFFARDPERKYSYKIELRIRNHTSLSRPTIIQSIADCMPVKHVVNLTNPDVFILVEVFKSVLGVAITQEYYSLHKFNVMEISNHTQSGGIDGEIRADGST